MEKSTTNQLWFINDLLRGFRRGSRTTKQLREWFPTQNDASRAIDRLLELEHREAERINQLPVEMRVWAHKEITNEEFDELIHKNRGKKCQEHEKAE